VESIKSFFQADVAYDNFPNSLSIHSNRKKEQFTGKKTGIESNVDGIRQNGGRRKNKQLKRKRTN
jgi:hypothetical protein